MHVLLLASQDALSYRVLRVAAAGGCSVDVLGLPGKGHARRLAWSRFCRRYDEMPARMTDDALLDRVTAIVRERGIAMVLPGDAPTTRWLSRYASRLPCRAFPVPSPATFEALNDKASFAGVCRAAGVAHPPTRVLPDVHALLAGLRSGEIRLPLVAKPPAASGSAGVQPLTESDSIHLLRRIDYSPVLVQDFVPGQDLSISVYCRGGSILASVIYRYLGGQGYFEIFNDEQVHALAARVLEHTRFDGVAGFDLRLSPEGKACLIECNPRFTYNLDISMLAGVNFVALGLEEGGGAATAELRAAPRRILHARPLKLWTLTGEHGRHMLEDNPRLSFFIHARDVFGARVRRALDFWWQRGTPLSATVFSAPRA